MKQVLAAAIKYATNHIIAHIPSYTVRHAWYRHVLGWRIGPNVTIFTGQHVQMARVRRSQQKVSIGKSTIINCDRLLYTTGGLAIGENASVSAGVWLLMHSPKLSPGGSRLQSFGRSPSCDGASSETYRTSSRRALAQKMSTLWKQRFRIRALMVRFSRLAPASRRLRERERKVWYALDVGR